MDWGAWEGYSLAELRNRFGRDFERNESSGSTSVRRAAKARATSSRVWRFGWNRSSSSDGPLVAVTHNGVLRALLALATGWDMIGKPPDQAAARDAAPVHAGARTQLTIVACNVPLSLGGASASDSGVSYPA